MASFDLIELDALKAAGLSGPREFAAFSARHVEARPVTAILLHDTPGAGRIGRAAGPGAGDRRWRLTYALARKAS
jgi:hypothetical protein